MFTKDGFLKSESLKGGYCQTAHIIDKTYRLYHNDGLYYFEHWMDSVLKTSESVCLNEGRKRMKYLNHIGYEIGYFKF